MNARQVAAILIVLFCYQNSAAAIGFWDEGFYNGAARTEYAPNEAVTNNLTLWYVNNGLPGAEGCLWDAEDSFGGCPGRAGLPPLPNSPPQCGNPNGTPVWCGTIQHHAACSGNPQDGETDQIGDSWRGCLRYDGGTYFEVSNPGSEYWIITANNDPAFDQCNPGPPGASQPIVDLINNNTSGLFKVGVQRLIATGTSRKRVYLEINASQFNNYCSKTSQLEGYIPFLSFGAHEEAGNGDIIGAVGTYSGYDGNEVVRFKAKISGYTPFGCKAGHESICTPNTSGIHVGFFVLAEWDSIPRFVYVNLFGDGAGVFSDFETDVFTGKWNWLIYESAFWPGADIVSVGYDSSLLHSCGIYLPRLSASNANWYTIDLGDLYRCLNANGLFTDNMTGFSSDVTGLHWFMESQGTSGRLRWWFQQATTTGSG